MPVASDKSRFLDKLGTFSGIQMFRSLSGYLHFRCQDYPSVLGPDCSGGHLRSLQVLPSLSSDDSPWSPRPGFCSLHSPAVGDERLKRWGSPLLLLSSADFVEKMSLGVLL